jgi:predicted ArsR family transcriptional regulator
VQRESSLEALSALAEPTRRGLYEFIASQDGWVSRDEAADAVGLERGNVAHHLDRLAADGLLEVDYQRRSGRQGPGAGRPAKLYRRARREFDVALPPRDYALAGQLLADAVDRSRSTGADLDAALDTAAAAEGRRIGDEIDAQLRAKAKHTREDREQAVLDALAEHGFEPHAEANGTVVLRNCPFHQLARQHTNLICGLNLCMLTAALDHIGDVGLTPHLEPEEDRCCVKLRPTG